MLTEAPCDLSTFTPPPVQMIAEAQGSRKDEALHAENRPLYHLLVLIMKACYRALSKSDC